MQSPDAARDLLPARKERHHELKQASINFQPGHLSEAAIAASRQVWLASLGAAVVTRDWVQTRSRHRVQDAGQGRHRRRVAGHPLRRRPARRLGRRARTRCGGAPGTPSRRRFAPTPTPRSRIVQRNPADVAAEDRPADHQEGGSPAKRAAAVKRARKVAKTRPAKVVRKAKRAVKKVAAKRA